MSLPHFLLGLFEISPMSGYDIVKAFDYSMFFYWHATHTQIYKTLKKLEHEQKIDGQLLEQDGNPSKTIFSITKTGKESLIKWLREESKNNSLKNRFIIKLALSAELKASEIIRHLEQYKMQLKNELCYLQSDEKAGFLQFARSAKEKILWESTVENGILYCTHEIEWANATQIKLSELLEKE